MGGTRAIRPGPDHRRADSAVVAAALLFYMATLAPGLLWGDSAKFQRMAYQAALRFDETGHPLWVLLAHPLTLIPGLDPALACNLLSAVLSALVLFPALRVMRRLGASPRAAAISCLALAVSHAYWLNAVVAEVYALNSLLMLGILDFVMRRCEVVHPTPVPPVPPSLRADARAAAAWAGAGLLLGAGVGNHLQLALWLPGLAWLVFRGAWAGAVRIGEVALAATGFALGLAPFFVLRADTPRSEPLVDLVQRLATQGLLPSDPLKDLAQGAGYLLYQFPVPLMLLAAALGAARLSRERRGDLIGLGVLYAASAAFAFSYQVPDRAVFYLPSYLVVALLAGPGLDRLAAWMGGSRPVVLALAFLCIVAPPCAYAVAPEALGARWSGLFPRPRDIPGRDSLRFHLYPGKTGYDGARRFCLDALTPLPQRAVVLADYTLHEPLNYVQIVEGVRPDVEVYYALPARQLGVALEVTQQGQAVFIAARDAGLYDTASLSTRFDIRPSGPIYELRLRADDIP